MTVTAVMAVRTMQSAMVKVLDFKDCAESRVILLVMCQDGITEREQN